jgi:hypothetical protein
VFLIVYVGTYVPSTNGDANGAQEPMADALAYLAKKPMSDADGSSQYPSLCSIGGRAEQHSSRVQRSRAEGLEHTSRARARYGSVVDYSGPGKDVESLSPDG